jgi:hypothetical protein
LLSLLGACLSIHIAGAVPAQLAVICHRHAAGR